MLKQIVHIVTDVLRVSLIKGYYGLQYAIIMMTIFLRFLSIWVYANTSATIWSEYPKGLWKKIRNSIYENDS
jgi:hypothetical protein